MVVLLDSDPSSPTKSQQSWPSRPETSAAGSSAAPSHYGATPQPSQAAPAVPPPAYEPNASAPLLPGPVPRQKSYHRLAASRRFCHAFSIALVIFIALSILKSVIFDRMRFGPIDWDNYPRPEDGNVLSCTDDWLTGQDDAPFAAMGDVFNISTIPGYPVFSASKSYSLPIDSSLHYIVARGGLSSGVLVVRGDEKADRDRIGVHVVARYHTRHALSRAEVCELRRSEGGVGLGIYTPSSRIDFGNREEDRIFFNVTVTIPISPRSVRNLNAFASNVQNFRHNIENLGDRVHFEHISLKGSNGAIQADQLFVSQGTINTSNGKITGKFNATDSLVIQTTNGAIDTDIGITNDDTHKASDLVLKTSNGRLSSRISLLTTHNQRPQPKGGHFTVRATTSNGRLNVSFPSTPINSLLDFEGHTTNGAADVTLHAAYEGSYYVTSSGSVDLDDEHPRDPTGRGRSRHLESKIRSRTVIQGTVVWDGDEDAEMGRAVISSSNGLARLRLL